MKAQTLGLLVLTGLASAPPERQEQSRPPIIDVHVHAYEKDEMGSQGAQPAHRAADDLEHRTGACSPSDALYVLSEIPYGVRQMFDRTR